MKSKLHSVFSLFMFMACFSVFGQNNYWTKSSAEAKKNNEKVHRASQPMDFQVFNLNQVAFKQLLINAPLQNSVSGRSSSLIIEFPMANGTFQKFSVTESPIMEPGLAERYPMIKTYKAIGIDDPTATMRFSMTQFGLHAMSLSGTRSTVYIDPYTEDRNSYIIYDRASLGKDTQDFECLVEENIDLASLETDRASRRNDTDDQKLREYRLALSCTGEYGQIFAGGGTVAQQKANVQAQMAITMNRVNEIYERDLAIRMLFIANNDDIIYLNPATDPWNGEYNTTTAQTIDAVIGVANYDIGHNFNTTGGGSAGCLGCVCSSQNQNNFHKGRAYTGRANPTGDAFDIDYVAHEMGHQYDGWHTMNTCSRSGNGMTEVEPASGSSIMGYAGICPTNVQSNSDAHFNYVNIRDISANIQSGVSSTCDVETNLTNQPPIADAGSDYSIPPSTAYVLRGSASDPDGTASLTYNWSQNDPEQAPGGGTPQSTWAQGPLYRAILPTTSPDRYMPSFNDVLNGNLTPTWEVTPSVSRSMEFSFIVRDNGSGFAAGIGQTDADLMMVTVEDVAPFTVNTPPAWAPGTTQTITWNVGETNNATINCQSVNILFSDNGGATFTTLASGVPNDGSEDVLVPNIAEINNARVIVEAADNIFYAVSEDFLISSDPDFAISTPNANLSACNIDAVSYDILFVTVNGFSENTTFSATGNPAGSTVTFTPNATNSDGTISMEVSNLLASNTGNYTITVTATSASLTKSIDVDLTVTDGVCDSVGNTVYQTSTTLVQFNEIDNASGKPSGYSDYTGISTDVNREESYDLVVNMNTDGNYTCHSTVWIDWNQNCVFDANETYQMGTATNTPNGPAGNSPLTVTVPADAVLGNTIMRVTTKFNVAATPCEVTTGAGSSVDAEVEDYTVNVLTSLSTDEFSIEGFSAYPNPNNGTFTVKTNTLNNDNITLSVFDIRGRRVFNKAYNSSSEFNETINLGNVQSGMYILRLSNGSKSITKKLIVE